MPVNFATKYSDKVVERFKLGSLTEKFFNRNYKWDGVKSIVVYSIDTAPMNDYQREGTSRYGTPAELGDTIQTMVLTKDRAFTYTIDKGNNKDQLNVKGAGRSLRRQIDEVVIPEEDKYRMEVLCDGAIKAGGKNETPTPIDETNAYSAFLDGQVYLTNHKVPLKNRKAACKASFYKAIHLDKNFIKNGDLSQKMLINGQMGEIDGVPLVVMPDDYFKKGVDFIITHPSVAVACDKLKDYKIHQDPPGINGNLVEGRVIYDAFILDSKKEGIYAHCSEEVE